ncbi:hypothetical protein AB0L09_33080 [Streptomyces zaomyceticus]
MYETLLPRLVDLLGEFTPVVEAAPPGELLADVRGALRYFDRTPAGGARPGVTPVVDDPVAFLRDRPVVTLDGVGRATARTLCGYGLDSVGRVADAPLAVLQRLVGAKTGRELWERARGIDRTPVAPHAASRSVAAERAFPRDETDRTEQRRALLSLAEELGALLRTEGEVRRGLTVTVRYADRTTTTRSRTLPEPTARSAALTALAYAVHDSLGLQRARVRGIALRAEGLTGTEGASYQISVDPTDEKARRIEAVADKARAKFGPRAVLPGSLAGSAEGAGVTAGPMAGGGRGCGRGGGRAEGPARSRRNHPPSARS